jgi:NitT/TauT family transport system substrate-binding protein
MVSAWLLAALFLGSCSPAGDSPEMQSVAIGMEATAVNSLIYIAEDRRYFATNGLKITVDDSYASGAAATEQMLEGKADVATTAEFALVRYAFSRKPARALASIDMFTHMKLIGRIDLGIHTISDLGAKRIGVPAKTAADFKLGRFLDLHGIDKSGITIVDVQAPQAVDALVKGAVDAVVAWQPHVMAIQERLGDKVTIFDVQSGQPMYCILVTRNQWAVEHPELIKRLMKSLLQAEEYLIQNRDQAESVVQKRLGYDDRYMATIWPEHQFSLRLDQSFILAMEDQARWMIENRLTDEIKVPHLLEYILEDSLKMAKPRSVNIIR